MSSRPCNYCLVEDFRRGAEETGATVHTEAAPLTPGFPDGKDIFVVPKGEKLDTTKDAKGNHGPQWKMWAAALPDRCVC